jgi:hypothetical protein
MKEKSGAERPRHGSRMPVVGFFFIRPDDGADWHSH